MGAKSQPISPPFGHKAGLPPSKKYLLVRQSLFSYVPSMALILLVQVQSQVFTAKCNEPQVGTSNGMDGGSGVAKFLSLRTEI